MHNAGEFTYELSEPQIRYNLGRCGLCGKTISREHCRFVKTIGYVCADCLRKKRTHVVYKCLFCQAAGFAQKRKPGGRKAEILLVLWCPRCKEPMNKLPL